MPGTRLFTLNPLSRILRLLSIAPLLLLGEHAVSATRTIDGTTLDIDGSAAIDAYRLINGATLNGNGTVTQTIQAAQSTLNLIGSEVQGGTAVGVSLQASDATISASTISSNRIALVLSHDDANTKGSTATVSGSTLTGGQNGATVNALSTLTLNGSTVTGTNAAGMRLFNGAVNANNSTIVGGKNGVQINFDPAIDAPSTLNLSGSHVVGRDGSAIIVDTLKVGSVAANIAVLDGSTLSGSNGVLMEVVNGAAGNLRVGNSHLVGDIVADGSSTANVTLENAATLTGRLDNVQNLAVNSDARWIMVGDGSVENLTLNGGGVQFGNPGEYFKLSVDSLSGEGGTFFMHHDFTTGQIDTLTVSGDASGNHVIALDSSGTEPLAPASTAVVHIGSGDATFRLAGGEVDLGAFSYDLVKQGNNDWFLNTATKTISPGTQSVMALFNAAPTVWYGELSTLRTRMGEVRLDNAKAGGWIRAYGNKFDVSASSGVAYQQTQQGLSFGADAPLPVGDGQWLVGLLGGYSKSDLNLARGTSGTVDSYYLGAYTT